MFILGGGQLRDKLIDLFDQIKNGYDQKFDRIQNYLDLSKEVDSLREQRNNLMIDRDLQNEKYNRREREIEHQLGLERVRQEQELKLSKREATLAVKEENLVADRKRFEDQMAFHEKRFTEEVGYLKGMIEPLLEALPKMTIKETVTKRR